MERQQSPGIRVMGRICGSEVQVQDQRTDKRAKENWAWDEDAHSLGCGWWLWLWQIRKRLRRKGSHAVKSEVGTGTRTADLQTREGM